MLEGKKTYIVAILMVVFNGIGWYLNYVGQGGIEATSAIEGIMVALGLAGLRKGVSSPTNGS